MRPNYITLSQSFPELGVATPDIAFDYTIYGLGSHPPPPLNLWESSTPEKEVEAMSPYSLKSQGCAWFKEKQKIIEAAPTILVVGGGALRIRKFIYSVEVESALHSISLFPRICHRYQGSVPGLLAPLSAL
jgi:apoptosis-inducing factor 2